MRLDDLYGYFSEYEEITRKIKNEDPHEIHEDRGGQRLLAKWYAEAEALDIYIDGVEIMQPLAKGQMSFIHMPAKKTQRNYYPETETVLYNNGKFLYYDTRDIII